MKLYYKNMNELSERLEELGTDMWELLESPENVARKTNKVLSYVYSLYNDLLALFYGLHRLKPINKCFGATGSGKVFVLKGEL